MSSNGSSSSGSSPAERVETGASTVAPSTFPRGMRDGPTSQKLALEPKGDSGAGARADLKTAKVKAAGGGDKTTKPRAPKQRKMRHIPEARDQMASPRRGQPANHDPSSDKESTQQPASAGSQADAAAATTTTANTASSASASPKKKKRKSWKKPKNKPNRPLSAYNLFFKSERMKMIGEIPSGGADTSEDGGANDGNQQPRHSSDPLKKRIHRKSHGKVGFAEMARVIGGRWKLLPADKRKVFEEGALEEKKRYEIELEAWRQAQAKAKDVKKAAAIIMPSLASVSPSSAPAASTARLPAPDLSGKISEKRRRQTDDEPRIKKPRTSDSLRGGGDLPGSPNPSQPKHHHDMHNLAARRESSLTNNQFETGHRFLGADGGFGHGDSVAEANNIDMLRLAAAQQHHSMFGSMGQHHQLPLFHPHHHHHHHQRLHQPAYPASHFGASALPYSVGAEASPALMAAAALAEEEERIAALLERRNEIGYRQDEPTVPMTSMDYIRAVQERRYLQQRGLATADRFSTAAMGHLFNPSFASDPAAAAPHSGHNQAPTAGIAHSAATMLYLQQHQQRQNQHALASSQLHPSSPLRNLGADLPPGAGVLHPPSGVGTVGTAHMPQGDLEYQYAAMREAMARRSRLQEQQQQQQRLEFQATPNLKNNQPHNDP
eukprot:CAMPEP_0119560084 /NCGR_PEP_ID=MMETSP1352-20130426/13942_1 /TAXON_ID=265584 /ORGANISM="Stauroneis constricta, Strain CCMP1120" /LENGTH=662 /DNA_ID=CAMNT_0007607973 /DNA_START=238 /DNA_END=2226 /DNA_ORIENTATION=-